MNQGDEIVLDCEHVSPCAEVLLQSPGRVELKKQQCQQARQRLRRFGPQRNPDVAAPLGLSVRSQTRSERLQWLLESSRGQRHRNHLRSSARRVEVAHQPIHARPVKDRFDPKDAIVPKHGMLVPEHFKVVADPKQVKELLVNDLEVGLARSAVGLDDLEAQLYGFAHPNRRWSSGQLNLVLDRHRQAQDELHPATRANARRLRPDVRIHRADEWKRVKRCWTQFQPFKAGLPKQRSQGQQGRGA